MNRKTQGTLAAIGAFCLWGILPVYWKALERVSATEILAHRVVWSLGFVILLLSLRRRWKEVRSMLASSGNLWIFLLSGPLLGFNWLVFIWAINTNQLVEVSLGYFINPLVNVCLGVLFLRERLYQLQRVAVRLALAGMVFLTVQYARIPWVALTLALTFGVYGLLRKTARPESMVGLLFDMSVIGPIAAVYLVTRAVQKSGTLFSMGLLTDVLLVGAGMVTATPLLLFAFGARRIRYSTLGLLQYIGPTGHLLVGVLLYGESFTAIHAISFGTVWAAIIIYSASGLTTAKRSAAL